MYDVTDEASFNNIRNWMRNIEQHASDNVNKVRPACMEGGSMSTRLQQHHGSFRLEHTLAAAWQFTAGMHPVRQCTRQ